MFGKFRSPPNQITSFGFAKIMELIVEQRVSRYSKLLFGGL